MAEEIERRKRTSDNSKSPWGKGGGAKGRKKKKKEGGREEEGLEAHFPVN